MDVRGLPLSEVACSMGKPDWMIRSFLNGAIQSDNTLINLCAAVASYLAEAGAPTAQRAAAAVAAALAARAQGVTAAAPAQSAAAQSAAAQSAAAQGATEQSAATAAPAATPAAQMPATAEAANGLEACVRSLAARLRVPPEQLGAALPLCGHLLDSQQVHDAAGTKPMRDKLSCELRRMIDLKKACSISTALFGASILLLGARSVGGHLTFRQPSNRATPDRVRPARRKPAKQTSKRSFRIAGSSSTPSTKSRPWWAAAAASSHA